MVNQYIYSILRNPNTRFTIKRHENVSCDNENKFNNDHLKARYSVLYLKESVS